MKNPQSLIRKSVAYSQNFLIKEGLIKALLDKSSLTKEDLVYEIGAGKGIITRELSNRVKRVIAVEIDDHLYHKLKEQFSSTTNVEFVFGDFLTHHLPTSPYKVFSNIPFNVTSAVVKKLIETQNPPEDAYIIVQLEASKKFTGSPYGKETMFSLLNKPFFELSLIHHFTTSDFFPPPGVKTVLLRLKKRESPLIPAQNVNDYYDFISFCFSQWKPTIQDVLKPLFTKNQLYRLSKDLHFSLSATTTQLSFEHWLGLFSFFLTGVDSQKRQMIVGSKVALNNRQAKLKKIHRTRTDKNWRHIEK